MIVHISIYNVRQFERSQNLQLAIVTNSGIGQISEECGKVFRAIEIMGIFTNYIWP